MTDVARNDRREKRLQASTITTIRDCVTWKSNQNGKNVKGLVHLLESPCIYLYQQPL